MKFSTWLEGRARQRITVQFGESAKSTLNLITNKEDTLAAFELMEGRFWLDYSMRTEGRNTIKAALEWLENRGEKYSDKPGDDYFSLFPNASFCIYGDGGIHRYFVKTNGDVRFSAGHALRLSPSVQRAKDLGFDVFGK